MTVLAILGLGSVTATAQSVCSAGPDNPTVRFETNLGDIDVLLCRADVQVTVDRFLEYVISGAYTDSGIVHRMIRSTPGVVPRDNIDIFQGGGFYVDSNSVLQSVTALPPTPLQAILPNVAGTIAMARTGDPDSATSQWFINVLDNPSLDAQNAQNPGYTVFGEVVAGMSVVDSIYAQEIWALNPGLLANVPLINYPNDGVSSPIPYFVTIADVTQIPEPAAALQGLAAAVALSGLASLRRRRAR
jgi:peptidyl-prolyl cis-trans isomerase A (cyclophilin A)